MNTQKLQIPLLSGITKNTPISDIHSLLDVQQKHLININPWPKYGEYFDLPTVSFKIAYNEDRILLKYDVIEKGALARYRQINDPVYKDSCVEFFISFDDEQPYYNFEFNRLGTCLCGYGPSKTERTHLPPNILSEIKYERTIEANVSAIHWTLTLSIPVQVFCYHNFTSLKQKKCRVNFYKCGDDLTQPHYLVWNDITSEEPNFHLPEFFMNAEFA